MSELPTGWEESRLGDIVELKYGSSLPEKTRVTGSFQVFGSNGPVGTHNKSITDAPVIVVGRKGSIGEIHYSGRECFPIDTTFFVDRFDACEPRFMLHLLKSLPLKSMNRATAIPGLNREDAYALSICVPPFREQRRIVAKIDNLKAKSGRARDHLDHLPRLVEKFKQAVLAAAFRGDLTREYRISTGSIEGRNSDLQTPNFRAESSFAQTDRTRSASRVHKARKIEGPTADHLSRIWEIPASWRWVQVGQCAFVTKLAGFEYTKYVKYDPDGDLDVLKAENAGPDGFRPTNYSRVRSDDVYKLARSTLRGSELIVVFVGAGTGNVGLVPEGKQFFLGPNIGMVRPNPAEASSRYMELFFRSSSGKRILLATSKAVAQPSLSMGAIRSTPIALPSVQEQVEIVRRIETAFTWVDLLVSNVTRARRLIDHLDQAVLAKAFRGELVPQDPADEPASVLLERIRAERTTSQRNTNAKERPKRTA